MKRIYLIISGFVQGVGFRSWAKSEAVKLGLSGWIKNREDETVEIVLEGKEQALKQFIRLAGNGPQVAEVEDVKVDWNEARGEYRTFEIRH